MVPPPSSHRHNPVVDTDEDDGSLVGTPDILTKSANVVRAPDSVNRVDLPVPSAYRDSRGEIHNFLVGGVRVNLLYTRAGVMRSGDVHQVTQRDFVFEGKVRVWTLVKAEGGGEEDVNEKASGVEVGGGKNVDDGKNKTTTETKTTVYTANQYVEIPPYIPHVFEFLEDTVLAEWWDGPFEAWFYRPYRDVVVEKSLSPSTKESETESSTPKSAEGEFLRYVLEQETNRIDDKLGVVATKHWFVSGTALLLIGLGVGYAIGLSRRCNSTRIKQA